MKKAAPRFWRTIHFCFRQVGWNNVGTANVTMVDNVLSDVIMNDVSDFTLSNVHNLDGEIFLKVKAGHAVNETERASCMRWLLR